MIMRVSFLVHVVCNSCNIIGISVYFYIIFQLSDHLGTVLKAKDATKNYKEGPR